ncbi:MAG: hypothetical protein JSU63_00170 [Phycisphaerales bacterium]|nr:MAG: hypothetical protein JSU63_00170 [Phycisphaerales bacterium]
MSWARLALISILFWQGMGVAYGQTVRYVDDDAAPGGDGASWSTAYRFLQDGLAAAGGGDEIRVAGGVYTPDQDEAGNSTPGDREAAFSLMSGAAMRGGYRGCPAGDCAGGDPDERDIAAFETILSGDLDGNDGPSFANNGENSYHVTIASGTDTSALLDGFTITAGNADGMSPHDGGGGMYNAGGSPTIRRCRFTGNHAGYGGALRNDGGTGTNLVNCVFYGNVASNWGGAIDNFSAGLTLVNCLFVGNQTPGEGGAMHNDLSEASLVNCTIAGNTADRGGGLFNYVGVSLTITNTILWDNNDSSGTSEGAQVYNNPSNVVEVDYSCIQGWTGVFGGVGNTGDDPLFKRSPDPGPDGQWNGVDDDYGNLRVRSGSSAVDAGINAVVTEAVDLDGIARIIDGDGDGTPTVDMGAYEHVPGVPTISGAGAVTMLLLSLGLGVIMIKRQVAR